MAIGLIHPDDPCFSWTDSVAEAVSETTNRPIRWRGIEYTMHSMTETTVSRHRQPEAEPLVGAAENGAEAIAESASRISTP